MSVDLRYDAAPIATDLAQSGLIAVYPAYSDHFRSLKPHHSRFIRSRVAAQSGRVAIYLKIDPVLARHYGFTASALDFIINDNIKYRLGKESEFGQRRRRWGG